MATRHKHRWQRLSDVALFCQCGETKAVAPAAVTICLGQHAPCTLPHYPSWPQWQPWDPPFIYTSGSTSAELPNVTAWNG
jgi:hypothetical protein